MITLFSSYLNKTNYFSINLFDKQCSNSGKISNNNFAFFAYFHELSLLPFRKTIRKTIDKIVNSTKNPLFPLYYVCKYTIFPFYYVKEKGLKKTVYFFFSFRFADTCSNCTHKRNQAEV